MQRLGATPEDEAGWSETPSRSLAIIRAALEPSLGAGAVDALLAPLQAALSAGQPDRIEAQLDLVESVMDAALLARAATE